MAILTANHWTIAATDIKVARETPYVRTAFMKLPTTSNTYPSLGIPIPSANKFGLRVLRSLTPLTNSLAANVLSTVSSTPGSKGATVNYDANNRTIRLHALSTTSITQTDLTELATTAEIGGDVGIYVEVRGH